MPFSAETLANLANASLDFHIRQQPESQTIQDRPLFNDLWAMKKTFPGGKEYIDGPVKGVYTSAQVGYEGDDEQDFNEPNNIKRWRVKWYETAANIKMSYSELKKNGIRVVEGGSSAKTVVASEAEMVQLSNIFDDKMEDLIEGSRRSLADMFWQDGTQDAKAVPGIQSFITSATTGLTFNIDRANSWWRNLSSLLISDSTPSDLNITNALQAKMRQLRRYGSPKHKMYAGSTFLSSWEAEFRSKGNFTLNGWNKANAVDALMADPQLGSLACQYDPHLDDLGYAKYAYILDHNAIKLEVMEGEDWKIMSPHRPPEVFVLYKQLTFTGALRANRLNTSAVFSVD